MLKHSLVVVFIVCLLCAGFSQDRAQKKGPPDFAKTLESAKKGWSEEKYGACIRDLQTCMSLVVKKRSAAIRGALPAAPEGWKFEPEKSAPESARNPMAAAMTASVGNVVERRYEQVEGNGRLDVSVMADSPMVKMLSMMFTNPAAAGPDTEQIGYGAHKGLFKKETRSFSLQILIADAHVIDVTLRPPKGMENEAAEALIFGLFDQAAVDRLAATLTE